MELTYEQWEQATPKERAEYFKWLVSQVEFGEKGNPINLEWFSRLDECFNLKDDRNYSENTYFRLKPIPKYRPFGRIAEFLPHVDRWFKWKDEDIYRRIYTLNNSENTVNEFCFQELFDECEFIDLTTGERTPFGMEVAE